MGGGGALRFFRGIEPLARGAARFQASSFNIFIPPFSCVNFHKSHGVKSAIDPFHKWLPIINSFAIIEIALTNLVFELIIQKNFYSKTSSVRLI